MELLVQQGAGLSEPNPSSKTLHYFPFASLYPDSSPKTPLAYPAGCCEGHKSQGRELLYKRVCPIQGPAYGDLI